MNREPVRMLLIREITEQLEIPENYLRFEVSARKSTQGAGALELAAKAMALADRSYNREIVPLYPETLSIEQKIERVAKEIYGAHSVYLESAARKRLQRRVRLWSVAHLHCEDSVIAFR